MKKQYQEPIVEGCEIRLQQLICVSEGNSGNNPIDEFEVVFGTGTAGDYENL